MTSEKRADGDLVAEVEALKERVLELERAHVVFARFVEAQEEHNRLMGVTVTALAKRRVVS